MKKDPRDATTQIIRRKRPEADKEEKLTCDRIIEAYLAMDFFDRMELILKITNEAMRLRDI